MVKKKSRAKPSKQRSRRAGATRGRKRTNRMVARDDVDEVDLLPDFTLVGIGASAGGLEAFSELVRALPEDFNLPIVLVQHLSPEHESLIPSLIEGTTHLKGVQATEGMRIRPGHIYVIPPNHSMEIARGRLKLELRPVGRAAFNPIDVFFRSLAESARHRSIGVVLSGSASDGAAGLVEIKTVGGITIVQKPETAKYDGMPRAAIATGAVDSVLSPTEIGHELAALGRHPYLTPPLLAEETAGGIATSSSYPFSSFFARSRESTSVSTSRRPSRGASCGAWCSIG